MKTSSPLLSIIVPVYNVETYLEECLGSLVNIQIDPKEIILINDGSTDRSGDIAEKFASDYPYIKIIHQQNQGLSATRNVGLLKAEGKYIMFVDSDDWIIENRLEEIFSEAIKSNADMIMGNALFCYPNGGTNNPFAPVPDSLCHHNLAGKYCFAELMEHGAFPPMVVNYLYKKEWLDKQRLHFENVLHEDELWTTQAMCKAEQIYITNIDFYGYRQREGSIMNTLNRSRRIRDLIYIANQLIRFASNYKFDDTEKNVKSQLYVKAYMLYQLAFTSLASIKNCDFVLPTHSLYMIYKIYQDLSPQAKPRIYTYYKNAKAGLKSYLFWRTSYWMSTLSQDTIDNKQIILIYNTMWNEPLNIPLDQIPDNYAFTIDRHYLNIAKVVVFHIPTLTSELEDDLDKPEGQLWVAWTLECEDNFPIIKNPDFTELFDYWISYHQDADVVQSYYKYDYIKLLHQPVNIESKQKDVCMLISSQFNNSHRQEYLQSLMQHLQIDSYGKLFNNKQLEEDTGRDSKLALYKQYKFVIAFENACATDYVTEKFFDPLISGAVPVYLGAPNIDDFKPGEHCFINVNDYPSPKELADYITKCCNDPKEYQSFFQWKQKELLPSFIEKAQIQKTPPFIRLCEVLENKKKEKQLTKEIENLGKIHLCAFADTHIQHSPARLLEQAQNFNLFNNIFIYNEHHLSTSFIKDFKSYLYPGSRGYGYWVWKPYLIMESLKKIQEGDILLYTDIGCHLNSNGLSHFLKYWKEVKNNRSGFLVTKLNQEERQEKTWTKGDLFDYFKVRNNPQITDTPQYQTGIIFIRKCEETIQIIQQWLDVYYYNFHLADDSPSISTNIDGFREHRHDQSILSILLKLHGTSTIPLKECYFFKWTLAERKYPILIKRDVR